MGHPPTDNRFNYSCAERSSHLEVSEVEVEERGDHTGGMRHKDRLNIFNPW